MQVTARGSAPSDLSNPYGQYPNGTYYLKNGGTKSQKKSNKGFDPRLYQAPPQPAPTVPPPPKNNGNGKGNGNGNQTPTTTGTTGGGATPPGTTVPSQG